ncbi:hypothetical protein J6590_065541 [Homalodisca vitripennis]|nr:hypothetical protein J6590_065541 [Homalodisca vitripennis]
MFLTRQRLKLGCGSESLMKKCNARGSAARDPHGIKQITVGPPHGIKQITMFIRENVEYASALQWFELRSINPGFVTKLLPNLIPFYHI